MHEVWSTKKKICYWRVHSSIFFPSCFKNQRKWNRTVIRVIHNLFLFKKRKRKYFYSVCNVIFIGVLFILFSLYKCNIFQWRFLKQAANVCMPVDNLFMSYFCLISYLMNPGIVINFHWGRGQKFNVINYWFEEFLENILKKWNQFNFEFLKVHSKLSAAFCIIFSILIL